MEGDVAAKVTKRRVHAALSLPVRNCLRKQDDAGVLLLVLV